MRYDLSRFKSGTDHIDRTYEPAAFGAESEDFRITSPVHLTADVTKSGAKFLLKGRLTATLELACSRCLENFDVPVDATLDRPSARAFNQATRQGGEVETGRRRGTRRRRVTGTRSEPTALRWRPTIRPHGDRDGSTSQMTRAVLSGAAEAALSARLQLCPVWGRIANWNVSCGSTVDPRFEVLRNLAKTTRKRPCRTQTRHSKARTSAARA